MNQNREARRAAAYQEILSELNLHGVPLAEEIAKAIHLDWSDNTTYNESLQLTIPQLKELIREVFGGLNMNNDVARITDNHYATILKQLQNYMKKMEGIVNVGGKRHKKKTRKMKKRSKKTRKY